MELNISFSDFSKEKKSNISTTFLPDKFDDTDYLKIAKAAFAEYINMLSGERVFSTIAQLYQYRLYLLIDHCFDGLIPSEDQVANIFKISIPSSKALIRNTKATYCFELKEALLKTMKAILKNIDITKDKVNSYYKVTIRSACLVNDINQLLRIDHPEFEPIKRLNRDTQFYKVSVSVYSKYK